MHSVFIQSLNACDYLNLTKECDRMGKIAIAIIATILFGYVGIIIGAMLNLG